MTKVITTIKIPARAKAKGISLFGGPSFTDRWLSEPLHKYLSSRGFVRLIIRVEWRLSMERFRAFSMSREPPPYFATYGQRYAEG